VSGQKKPQSPVAKALRVAILGGSFGLAAFVAGVLISSRLAISLLGPITALQSNLARFLVSGLIREVPVLFAAPLIAFVAGLFLDAPRKTLVFSMVFGAQLFPIALDVVGTGLEGLAEPANLALLVVATIGGALLCLYAYGRGQQRARERDAAVAHEPPSGTLAKIDFEAVKRAQDAEASGSSGSTEAAPQSSANEQGEKPQAPSAPAAGTGS
jgi:hypothetical protein